MDSVSKYAYHYSKVLFHALFHSIIPNNMVFNISTVIQTAARLGTFHILHKRGGSKWPPKNITYYYMKNVAKWCQKIEEFFEFLGKKYNIFGVNLIKFAKKFLKK